MLPGLDFETRLQALERQAREIHSSGPYTFANDGSMTIPALNVGSATGAATGEIRASDSLKLNSISTASLKMRELTIGAGGSDQLLTVTGSGSGTLGFVFVADTAGTMAIYRCSGAGEATAEIADSGGTYSVTAGTGSSTNIYWSAGNSRYEIQNNTGGGRTYYIMMFTG